MVSIKKIVFDVEAKILPDGKTLELSLDDAIALYHHLGNCLSEHRRQNLDDIFTLSEESFYYPDTEADCVCCTATSTSSVSEVD